MTVSCVSSMERRSPKQILLSSLVSSIKNLAVSEGNALKKEEEAQTPVLIIPSQSSFKPWEKSNNGNPRLSEVEAKLTLLQQTLSRYSDDSTTPKFSEKFYKGVTHNKRLRLSKSLLDENMIHSTEDTRQNRANMHDTQLSQEFFRGSNSCSALKSHLQSTEIKNAEKLQTNELLTTFIEQMKEKNISTATKQLVASPFFNKEAQEQQKQFEVKDHPASNPQTSFTKVTNIQPQASTSPKLFDKCIPVELKRRESHQDKPFFSIEFDYYTKNEIQKPKKEHMYLKDKKKQVELSKTNTSNRLQIDAREESQAPTPSLEGMVACIPPHKQASMFKKQGQENPFCRTNPNGLLSPSTTCSSTSSDRLITLFQTNSTLTSGASEVGSFYLSGGSRVKQIRQALEETSFLRNSLELHSEKLHNLKEPSSNNLTYSDYPCKKTYLTECCLLKSPLRNNNTVEQICNRKQQQRYQERIIQNSLTPSAIEINTIEKALLNSMSTRSEFSENGESLQSSPYEYTVSQKQPERVNKTTVEQFKSLDSSLESSQKQQHKLEEGFSWRCIDSSYYKENDIKNVSSIIDQKHRKDSCCSIPKIANVVTNPLKKRQCQNRVLSHAPSNFLENSTNKSDTIHCFPQDVAMQTLSEERSYELKNNNCSLSSEEFIEEPMSVYEADVESNVPERNKKKNRKSQEKKIFCELGNCVLEQKTKAARSFDCLPHAKVKSQKHNQQHYCHGCHNDQSISSLNDATKVSLSKKFIPCKMTHIQQRSYKLKKKCCPEILKKSVKVADRATIRNLNVIDKSENDEEIDCCGKAKLNHRSSASCTVSSDGIPVENKPEKYFSITNKKNAKNLYFNKEKNGIINSKDPFFLNTCKKKKKNLKQLEEHQQQKQYRKGGRSISCCSLRGENEIDTKCSSKVNKTECLTSETPDSLSFNVYEMAQASSPSCESLCVRENGCWNDSTSCLYEDDLSSFNSAHRLISVNNLKCSELASCACCTTHSKNQAACIEEAQSECSALCFNNSMYEDNYDDEGEQETYTWFQIGVWAFLASLLFGSITGICIVFARSMAVSSELSLPQLDDNIDSDFYYSLSGYQENFLF